MNKLITITSIIAICILTSSCSANNKAAPSSSKKIVQEGPNEHLIETNKPLEIPPHFHIKDLK